MDKEKLRYFAEEILKQYGIKDSELFKKDIQQLVEELSIYQIELEHQNQEFRFSQQELFNLNQKYQDIFINAPVAYFIVDYNYKIFDVNNTAAKMLDIPVSTLKGTNFTRYIHPAFQDNFYFHFNKAFEKNFDSCFIKLKNKDNNYFFVKLVSQLDKTGNRDLLRIAIIDNQKEKELEVALIEEKNKAQENHKIFSHFMLQVLDELKKMILKKNTITVGNVELQEDSIMPFNDDNNCAFLLELITDVNEIISLNNSNFKPQINKIDLNNLFNNIFVHYEKDVRQKKIHFYLNKKCHRNDYIIQTDEKILTVIVHKLIKNALKYAQTGDIEFGFEINIKDVDIFVKHYESIIDEDFIEELNDIFNKKKYNSFKHFKTLGNRLSIIYDYVRILSGEIQINHNSNEIIFKITLPF